MLLAGCTPTASSPDGSARFAVALAQQLSASIARVTVTASASDFAPRSVDLVVSEGVWSGFLGHIPAGADRAFFAQAFDASDTLLFQGSASGITILPDQTALVALTLQPLSSPPPFDNEAPLIDSLLASATSVAVGGTISLSVTAHDPNPEDTLTYAWTSTAGAFSSPTGSATSWTAPAASGLQTLTVTVTDSRGLAASISLRVAVTASGVEGNAWFFISFNTAPLVSAISAAPSWLAVGQTVSVSALASDLEGDRLSYAWSASCAGTWANAASASARFTPTALPSEACNNCRLTVSVSDGRGAQHTGSVALCVSNDSAPAPHLPPVLVSAAASSPTAAPSQKIHFDVVARDPEGSALSFFWSASVGVLDAASTGATRSRVTWTAPTCVSSAGIPLVVTATVTNAFHLTVTNRFTLTGLPVCSPLAWVSTGTMSTPRSGHTTTRLTDGRVLAVGGDGIGRVLATAEVYDPATGAWSMAASMTSPRTLHTATLLSDGKVLVVGGDEGARTAEVYDPATNAWSTTGALNASRYVHTATLLPNGKVLVVGQADDPAAEVYDPATGAWSATGAMHAPHSLHTATLLSNGRVLVAGGGTASTEVYDPASNTWSITGSLTERRSFHKAALLPTGKVLAVGGQGDTWSTLLTAEMYDPATGAWSMTASMATPRAFHTAVTLPNGKVLVAGGISSAPTAKTEVYDPATDAWSTVTSMTASRSWHDATLLANGQVLVSGGQSNEGSAEVYTPDARFSGGIATGAMNTPRRFHTATLLSGGRVLVVGGMNESGPLAEAEIYHPATGTWSPTAPMSSPRFLHTATPLPHGKVLVVGSNPWIEDLATGEVYDPASGTWSPTTALALPLRLRYTATLLPDGRVLVSGESIGHTPVAQLYDPAANTWSVTGAMTVPRSGHTATLLPNGKVLVTGGSQDTSTLTTSEVFDPASGSWSVTGAMASARAGHSATLLPNGKVLVTEGEGSVDLERPELYDPTTGVWSTTGPRITRRFQPSVTLLSDGRVLVTEWRDVFSSQMEAYDPTTNTWSAAGTLAFPRVLQHTATLLPNGQVLLAGGYFSADMAEAELYLP
ncbi:kelch repeat-containing protein [Archangium primigenium]|uniref:kelch repeat-containing protein n=1 Tax=[Archangium] primigenium TaxID=2792470 RepID=UPI001EF964DC|nr:kelch repeat-containing protein [Archangium primigenium]